MNKPLKFSALGLAAIAAGALCFRMLHEAEPRAQASEEQIASAPPLAGPPSHTEQTPTELSTVGAPSRKSADRRLSDSELKTFSSWMQDRGYPFQIQAGGLTGVKTFTGYEATDEETLRGLAAQGDKTAALVLAEKILVKDGEFAPPTDANFKQAQELLLDASVRGYTASLSKLSDMYQLKAQQSRQRSENFDPQASQTALQEAYKFAYLLQQRGDVNAQTQLEMLRATGRLPENAESEAKGAAIALHAEMNSERQRLGMPPFSDGVPKEVLDIAARFVALHTQQ